MIVLDGNSLTLDDLVAIAFDGDRVSLDDAARARVRASREVVEQFIRGDQPVYGVNTGFGSFADVRIPSDSLAELQVNLLRSHAAGVGEPLPIPVVRATMALRANVLAKGFSGIRLDTLERLLRHFEPFGIGNPAPLLATRGIRLASAPRAIGQNGLKFALRDETTELEGVWWGVSHRASEWTATQVVDVAYRLERDLWRDTSRLVARLADIRG